MLGHTLASKFAKLKDHAFISVPHDLLQDTLWWNYQKLKIKRILRGAKQKYIYTCVYICVYIWLCYWLHCYYFEHTVIVSLKILKRVFILPGLIPF